MNMLEFGNLQDIAQVYNGKENKMPRKRGGKKSSKLDYQDIRKFMLKKEYIYIQDGQTFYNYDKLKKKQGVFVINLNIKDTEEEYKSNLKLLKKFNKITSSIVSLTKKINKEIEDYKKKGKIYLNCRNSTLENLEKTKKELEKKIFFY